MKNIQSNHIILLILLIILISSCKEDFFIEENNEKTSQEFLDQDMILVEGGYYQMGDVWNKPYFLNKTVAKGMNIKDLSYDAEDSFWFTKDCMYTHWVKLNSFYIGRYEVTFDLFDQYCIETGAELKKTGPTEDQWNTAKNWTRSNSPAIYVLWIDAIKFCNWFSLKQGLQPCYTILENAYGNHVAFHKERNGYRLPTEAEWEYVAKGGPLIKDIDGGKGSFYAAGCDEVTSSEKVTVNGVLADTDTYMSVDEGADIYNTLKQYAWFNLNSGWVGKDVDNGCTHNVGMKKPNVLGLYDMSGNAWEWCFDLYSKSYYSKCMTNEKSVFVDLPNGEKAISNPIGPEDVGVDDAVDCHVLRGGSWGNYPVFLRSTFRFFSINAIVSGKPYSSWRTGFRLVRNVP